jgi:EmrB/QacA subfamily drug resistance transporter
MSDHRPDPRRWQVLILLSAAFFMTILDSTILLTALPSIEAGLGVSGAEVSWTVTGYGLAFSGLLLCCGRLADVFGRKRVFLAGMVLRVLSALLCGLAPSVEFLIAARALQGVSAAIIAPAALSLLMTAFPDGPERNRALGIWGGLGGVGATSGLLLGGVITDVLGWRWVFLINVPVGLAVLTVGGALLRETRAAGRGRLNAAGALTVTAALVLLVYTIIELPARGWTGATAVALGSSLALFAAFWLIETRSVAPLVPARLLRSRSLVGGNAVILAAGMAVDGMLITLTGYVQQAMGWSALRFGLVAAVMTVASVVGGLSGQRAALGFGVRRVAMVGAALLVVGCLLLTQVSAAGSVGLLLAGQLIFGVGMGGTFVCAQIAALSGAKEADSGLAAGVVDTSFSMGTALGIAICTSVAAAVGRLSKPDGLGVADGLGIAGLVDGHRAAFGTAGLLALLGLVAAVWLLPRDSARPPRDSAERDTEPTAPACR